MLSFTKLYETLPNRTYSTQPYTTPQHCTFFTHLNTTCNFFTKDTYTILHKYISFTKLYTNSQSIYTILHKSTKLSNILCQYFYKTLQQFFFLQKRYNATQLYESLHNSIQFLNNSPQLYNTLEFQNTFLSKTLQHFSRSYQNLTTLYTTQTTIPNSTELCIDV